MLRTKKAVKLIDDTIVTKQNILSKMTNYAKDNDFRIDKPRDTFDRVVSMELSLIEADIEKLIEIRTLLKEN